MITINKAILHIFDPENSNAMLSDTLLTLNEDQISFLTDHISKCFNKSSLKPGRFIETSSFHANIREYMNNDDFVSFSKAVANIWFDVLHQAEGILLSDLFICDIIKDDVRYLVFLRISNKRSYVHQIMIDDGIRRNEIQAQPSVPAGTSEECILFSTEDEKLLLLQKKYEIDGNSINALSEAVAECVIKPSQQETLKTIRKTAEKVAEDFGADTVQTAASVKTALVHEMEDGNKIDPIRTGNAVFAGKPAMQEAFQQKMQNAGYEQNEVVPVNKESLLKKVINHKLKTDTGIELTIPAEYFDDTEFIEFNHAEDGSLYITLKHISSIVNKG